MSPCDLNEHVIEEIVRQVGYLPELYKDARSEKYIKKRIIVMPHRCALLTGVTKYKQHT
jgi:uncharacterized Rmd1/YagE family protein